MSENVKSLGITNFSASNPGDADDCNFADYSLWTYNSESADFLKSFGFDSFCVSPEINIAQLRALKSPLMCEAVVYGKIPVMVTRNCFVKCAGSCGTCSLSDRKGKVFDMQCRPEFSYSEVLNAVPLYMGDKTDDFKNTCVNMLRLIFTNETPEQCAYILRSIREGREYRGEFTRGHYYRGV